MKYALKKLRRMRVEDLATGVMTAMLTDLKNGQFTGSQETVYAEGTDGSKLVGFDLNKVAGFNATNGAVDLNYLGLQVGSDRTEVQNGTGVSLFASLTTKDGKTVVAEHTAAGAVGAEIGFIYPYGADGMPDLAKAYAQSATASATEFAYNPETNVITLPVGAFKAGDKVCFNYHPTFNKYGVIENRSDRFSKTGRVIIDAWFTDICTEMDVPLQVVMEKGRVSGELDLSFGDQAAVQNIAVEAMASVCGEGSTLWKLYDYDMNEIVSSESIAPVEPEVITHSVYFVNDDTTCVVVNDGDTVAEPVAPTKDGYTFDGWYRSGNKFDFSTPITTNITLIAQWTAVRVAPDFSTAAPLTLGADASIELTALDGTAIQTAAGTNTGDIAIAYDATAQKFQLTVDNNVVGESMVQDITTATGTPMTTDTVIAFADASGNDLGDITIKVGTTTASIDETLFVTALDTNMDIVA